jgi:hypothetical protein
MILVTHYFCDFNRLLFLLNHTLLREVFFCQNLTFIWLPLKAVMIMLDNDRDRDYFVNCLLGCIFTWSGSSSYANNPVLTIFSSFYK